MMNSPHEVGEEALSERSSLSGGSGVAHGMRRRVCMQLRVVTWRYCSGSGARAALGMYGHALVQRGVVTWMY